MMYMGFLAVFEATSLAAGAGLSQEKLLEVTRANGVLTTPMEAYLQLRNRITANGLDEGMRPFVKGFAALADKDLEIALEAAQEHGVRLPGGERCREQMERVYGVADD
jgi:3-hydroxyisobutyrate dehydrogenase-like beta-hydroxyacid dehydrogenase